MENKDNKKKYFAFISYKRADEEWAKWFQNELENYHFPSTLNGRSDIAEIIEAIPEAFRPPKEFRPVFRDYDELIAGNLPEQIYSALRSSLNLVVICSPHLADDEEAQWVNKEISDFIEIGKKEGSDNIRRIFPFIVEGKPHSGDEQECFPKVLRDLSAEQERIGGNVNEGGNVSEINRERAFVKVLAGMLPEGVDNDMLWPRYDHDKMERERKEKEARDRLLIAQSRFVAEKAMKLIDEGDFYLARRLAIEILPKDFEKPDRPYTPESEVLIRKACEKNNAILRHDRTVINAIFNKDESKIFSRSFDGFLRIWDFQTGKMFRKIKTTGIAPIICHPIMPIVAIAEKDKIVFRNAKNFNCIGKPILHPHNANEIDYYIGSMAFSKNGKFVVSGTSDGRIFVWCFDDGRLIQTFLHEEGEDLLVSDINFDLEGTIITTTYDTTKVWKFDGEKTVFGKCLYKHKNSECQVKVAGNGRYIVFSSDNVIYFCDSNRLEFVKSLRPNEEGITGFDISGDNKSLVVGSGHCLYVWECDLDTAAPFVKRTNALQIGFNVLITDVKFNQNGNLVIVSLDNGDIRLVDLNKTDSPRVLKIRADTIDFSPNGKMFAIITKDGWNPAFYSTLDYEPASAAKILDDETIKMLVDNRIGFDENQITFSNKNNSVFVLRGAWRVEINKLDIEKNRSEVCMGNCDSISNHRCVFKTISRNGKRVVCVLKDGTMLLINANNGGDIKIMEPPTNRTTMFVSVAFSYDSRFLVSSIENKPNKVWDADTGKFITELPMSEKYSGGDVCFDKSGKRILLSSKSLGGSLYVWDWDDRKNEAQLRWPIIKLTEPKRIEKSAFNADGSLIVTASYEDIRVWDVQSGLMLKEYNHSYNKKFVCFSPDGSKIFSSDGAHVFVYDYPSLQHIITETRKRFRKQELSIEERKQYYLE